MNTLRHPFLCTVHSFLLLPLLPITIAECKSHRATPQLARGTQSIISCPEPESKSAKQVFLRWIVWKILIVGGLQVQQWKGGFSLEWVGVIIIVEEWAQNEIPLNYSSCSTLIHGVIVGLWIADWLFIPNSLSYDDNGLFYFLQCTVAGNLHIFLPPSLSSPPRTGNQTIKKLTKSVEKPDPD